jgi:hypothetical protein
MTQIGFGILGLLWCATGVMAYLRIRAGNVADHRRWMMRNFALLLAGVMLRVQTPLLSMAVGFEIAYQIVAWSSWLPNLLVAEWLLRQRPTTVTYTANGKRRTQAVVVHSG